LEPTGPNRAYHLISLADLQQHAETAPVRPHSLAVEGFVHLTHREGDLIDVANAFYRDEAGPHVVLAINLDLLSAPWRYDGDERFPHVYGPLDRGAISGIEAIGRRPDGTFVPLAEPSTSDEGRDRRLAADSS
jgi:uncharacterized protein (DUF952 family)